LCYERSVLANRVHDLLTAIEMARGIPGVKSVRLLGLGECAPAALLARALAGDAVARAAVVLDGFDFDSITDDTDPRLLPGALKYGGVRGFAALCAGRPTFLYNARPPDASRPSRDIPDLIVTHDPVSVADALTQLLAGVHP
jgi:hypothetical protein